ALLSVTATSRGMFTGRLQFRDTTLRLKGGGLTEGYTQFFPPSVMDRFAGGTLSLQLTPADHVVGFFISLDGTVFQMDAAKERSNEPLVEAVNYTALLETKLEGNPAG